MRTRRAHTQRPRESSKPPLATRQNLERGLYLPGDVGRHPLVPDVRHVLEEPLGAVLAVRLVLGHPQHDLADLGLGPAALAEVVLNRGINALYEWAAGERDHLGLSPIVRLRIRAILL